MNRIPITIVCILLTVTTHALMGQGENKLLLGVWKPAESDTPLYVKVYQTDQGQINGKIMNDYRGEDEPPTVSHKNKMIISGFQHEDNLTWRSGHIHDPEDGDHYRGKITLLDIGKIEIRAYSGIFWKDMQWVKVHSNDQLISMNK